MPERFLREKISRINKQRKAFLEDATVRRKLVSEFKEAWEKTKAVMEVEKEDFVIGFLTKIINEKRVKNEEIDHLAFLFIHFSEHCVEKTPFLIMQEISSLIRQALRKQNMRIVFLGLDFIQRHVSLILNKRDKFTPNYVLGTLEEILKTQEKESKASKAARNILRTIVEKKMEKDRIYKKTQELLEG